MIQIGLVGAGGMGLVHLNNYAHISGCRVTALCDKSPNAKEIAEARGLHYYGELQEMLKHETLDAVDICTPTFLHRQHVEAALQAGKHVLCEKPLCLCAADAQMLMDLAESVGRVLFVGQVVQYMAQTRVLKRLVRTGCYGKVLDASFRRGGAAPRWVKDNWLFQKECSGLLPFDLHIHDLDLIVSLFGAPQQVQTYACGNTGVPYREQYRFLYTYPTFQVQAEAAWYHACAPFEATWRVYFETALVVLYPDGGVTAYPYEQPERRFDVSEAFVVETGINLPPTGMFYEELSDFIAQILQGDTGCARAAEITSVIRILEAIET